MARQYYKDSTTGQMKPLGVKVEDTLPVGTEVDYDGTDIPEGWEEVDNVLWENTSPTSNFAAQTINLIENDYTEYDLYYKINKDIDYMKVERLIVGQKAVLVVPAIEGFFGYVVNRNITSITNSAITFGAGRMNNTDHNENMIPVKVIGIK